MPISPKDFIPTYLSGLSLILYENQRKEAYKTLSEKISEVSGNKRTRLLIQKGKLNQDLAVLHSIIVSQQKIMFHEFKERQKIDPSIPENLILDNINEDIGFSEVLDPKQLSKLDQILDENYGEEEPITQTTITQPFIAVVRPSGESDDLHSPRNSSPRNSDFRDNSNRGSPPKVDTSIFISPPRKTPQKIPPKKITKETLDDVWKQLGQSPPRQQPNYKPSAQPQQPNYKPSGQSQQPNYKPSGQSQQPPPPQPPNFQNFQNNFSNDNVMNGIGNQFINHQIDEQLKHKKPSPLKNIPVYVSELLLYPEKNTVKLTEKQELFFYKILKDASEFQKALDMDILEEQKYRNANAQQKRNMAFILNSNLLVALVRERPSIIGVMSTYDFFDYDTSRIIYNAVRSTITVYHKTKKVMTSPLKFLLEKYEFSFLKQFILFNVKHIGLSIKDFPKHQTPDIQLAAIEENIQSIEYIANPNNEIIWYIIERDPLLLKYIEFSKLSKTMVDAALKKNGLCIQYMKDTDEKQKVYALTSNIESIRFMYTQSIGIQTIFFELQQFRMQLQVLLILLVL